MVFLQRQSFDILNFTKRTERLCNNVQLLRDYSIQVREVYQAQVDIKQNQIMKVLTVVTTVFCRSP